VLLLFLNFNRVPTIVDERRKCKNNISRAHSTIYVAKGIYCRNDFGGGLAGAPVRDLPRVAAAAERDESSRRTARSAARGSFHPLGGAGSGGSGGGRMYNDNNIIDRY